MRVPAVSLTDKVVEVPIFAVVATEGEDRFVCHVAVTATAQRVVRGAMAVVYHQTPPLQLTISSPPSAKNRAPAHALGWLPLSDNAIAATQIWLEDARARIPSGRFSQYIVEPPIKSFFDPTTGHEVFRFYSCVGFVLDLYEEGAGSPIPLSWRNAPLPLVPDQVVARVWPAVVRLTKGPTMSLRLSQLKEERCDLGFSGDGPWPLVLPGYAITSLSQARTNLFLPTALDDAKIPEATELPPVVPSSGGVVPPKGSEPGGPLKT